MSFNNRRNINEQELNVNTLCKLCKKGESTCAVCKDNIRVVQNSCINIGGNYIASAIEPTRENLWNPEKFYDAMNAKPSRIVIPDVTIKASFPGLPDKKLYESARPLRSFQYRTPVISTGRLPPKAKSPGRYNSTTQNGGRDAAFLKRKCTEGHKVVIDEAEADSDILPEEADIDILPAIVPELVPEREADFDMLPPDNLIQADELFDASAVPNERNLKQKHAAAVEHGLAPKIKRVVYVDLRKDETLDDILIEFRRKD